MRTPETVPSRVLEILILAPTGQDATLITTAVAEGGTRPRAIHTIPALCERISDESAAAVIIAEEALTNDGIAHLNEALKQQPPWSDMPIILMTNGGETTHAILRIKNAFSPSGNLTLLERPFRRITLQSVVQVALRARRKQYEIKALLEAQTIATQLRDEFISIASHELRTPLTSLKLQIQINELLMAKNDPSVYAPERMQKFVQVTGRQVDRLSRLVDEMLDVSRINNGRLTIQRETFDMAELVREVVERTLPQLQAAHCVLDLQVSGPVMGHWDRYRIEQVVTNLLSNVVRYCPGAPVCVGVSRASSHAVLSVRDEGPGIAIEDQQRIFDRFERATPRAQGLGLGLYISREIIEEHEGAIRLESKVGSGSNFVVTLPLTAASGMTAS